MPHGPKDQQVLIPPQTRLTTAWHLAWQRFYGVAPRGPLKLQRSVIPAIRRQAYTHRVRR